MSNWFLSKHYNFKRFDVLLVVVVFILFLISSFILSIIPSSGQVGSAKRQIFTIGMGLCVILVFSLIDYHTLCMYVPILYIITTLMVAGTRFSPLGSNAHTDSYRWLDFKVVMFQPSEVCKIVVILTLACDCVTADSVYFGTIRSFIGRCCYGCTCDDDFVFGHE